MASLTLSLSAYVEDGAVTSNIIPQLTFTDTAINFKSMKDISIAAGATDQAVSFDGITAKYLLVTFDGTVNVKLDSTGNTAQDLTPSASNPAFLIMLGGSVSAMFVSNPGGSPVKCKLFIASN